LTAAQREAEKHFGELQAHRTQANYDEMMIGSRDAHLFQASAYAMTTLATKQPDMGPDTKALQEEAGIASVNYFLAAARMMISLNRQSADMRELEFIGRFVGLTT
jgi:hypothetical protein